jgi:obg-like ATPase 1
MPPKKVEAPEQKPLIGRVGTNLKIGIVGIPNVGKSTFFNVITNSAAPAENFPFCTIDPNEARVPVPDDRYDFLVEYHKPARLVDFTTRTYEFFDGNPDIFKVVRKP